MTTTPETRVELDAKAVDAAIAAAVDHQREDDPEAARWPCDYDGDEVSHARDRMGRAISAYIAAATPAQRALEVVKDYLTTAAPAAPAPAPEPVAWGAYRTANGDFLDIAAEDEDIADVLAGFHHQAGEYVLRPLFAAPPAPVAASAVDAAGYRWSPKGLGLWAYGPHVPYGVIASEFDIQPLVPVADNPAGDPVVNAPRVRELEWGDSRITEDGRTAEDAQTPFGRYVATNTGWFLIGQTGYETERGLDAAKAAAQSDYERRVLACLEPGQATHRHIKRGTLYRLLGYGEMQTEWWRELFATTIGGDDWRSVDGDDVAIYQSVDDGSLWVRPSAEFNDGRFEALPPPPAAEGSR